MTGVLVMLSKNVRRPSCSRSCWTGSRSSSKLERTNWMRTPSLQWSCRKKWTGLMQLLMLNWIRMRRMRIRTSAIPCLEQAAALEELHLPRDTKLDHELVPAVAIRGIETAWFQTWCRRTPLGGSAGSSTEYWSKITWVCSMKPLRKTCCQRWMHRYSRSSWRSKKKQLTTSSAVSAVIACLYMISSACCVGLPIPILKPIMVL